MRRSGPPMTLGEPFFILSEQSNESNRGRDVCEEAPIAEILLGSVAVVH